MVRSGCQASASQIASAVYAMPMPRKPKSKPDDPAESKRFIDMARELGADETEKGRKAFERTFKKVVERRSPPKRGSG